MDRFVFLTFDGLSKGAVLAAFALALVLIWRAARIVNFAQGAMALAAAYAGYSVTTATGSYWLGFGVATVRREGIERKGGAWSAEEEADFRRPTLEMFARQSHPLYASARLWDDGVIDPRKTRAVLALSLSAALNAPVGETRFGVFRM